MFSLMHRRDPRSMKRLYNWFHNYYGLIEKSLGLKLDTVIQRKIMPLDRKESKTVLEYACGSGLLSLKLAPLFKTITGRDLSEGMINRAKERTHGLGAANVSFGTGNIVEPDEPLNS